MIINKNDVKYFIIYSLISLSLLLIHYTILTLLKHTTYIKLITETHLFLYLLTLIFSITTKFILKKAKMHTFGYIYLAAGLLKMFICVFYLFPTIRLSFDFKKLYIIQFFVIYFIYLFMEISYFVSQNKKE